MSNPHNGNGAGKTATVVQVRESLVLIQIDEQSSVKKNEVGYVCVGDERLKAEVLRIRGRTADMQVFEDTTGVRVGDRVEMTDEMLSAMLGPGLLGRVFDGLQSPLHEVAEQYGFFLPRAFLPRRWTRSANGSSRPSPRSVRGFHRAACSVQFPKGRSRIRFSFRLASRNR